MGDRLTLNAMLKTVYEPAFPEPLMVFEEVVVPTIRVGQPRGIGLYAQMPEPPTQLALDLIGPRAYIEEWLWEVHRRYLDIWWAY